MRTSNPTISARTFRTVSRQHMGSHHMTLDGTINRSFLLLGILILTAGIAWNMAMPILTFPAVIIGLILALATIFKPEWSPTTAPLYAAVEGVFLGSISLMFETAYPGIVSTAILATFTTLFFMLFLYKARVIVVNDQFRSIMIIALCSIAALYFLGFILRLFGIILPIFASGTFGIIFSAIVVVIAAFSLLLDFDLIEQGVQYKSPSYMEWYASFALLVTLIWLYIEILNLLAKLRSND